MADVNTTQLNQSFNALTQEVQSLTTAIRTLLQSQSAIQQTQATRNQQQQNANKQLTEFEKSLRKGRKANAEQEALIKKAIELKKREAQAADVARKAQEDLTAATKAATQNAKQIQQLQAAKDAADRNHANAMQATTEASGEVEKSFKKVALKADLASAALAWFGNAVSAQAKQIMTQNRANGGLVEGTGNLISAMASQQNEALKYKLDATTFANITTSARQMFNAMGGTAEGLKELDSSINRFTIMTNSFEDGLKMATQTANDFANKGIRPTALAMEMYQNDLVSLRRQTGLSVEQAHELYNSVAEEAESIDILRSARAGERDAILRSQRALIQQSIAAGMSAAQAKEAAKMLNKMVAAKPLDRLKQAAKVRALSGAMGIAGGEQAAQAITAGKRATPEQQKALQDFSQRMANAMDVTGRQDLGTEIFATTLLDKLDLDQYYGKNSQFSTTLGDSLKNANGDLAQKYQDFSKDRTAELVMNTLGIWETAKQIVSGQHWLGPIAAGVAAIATVMIAKGPLTSGVGKLIEKVAGKGAAGAVGKAGAGAVEGAAGAATGAAKGSSALSKLGTVGKVLGPAAAIGVGAYEGYDHYQQTGKTGEAVGKGVGSAAGGIGGGWGGAAAGAALGTLLFPGVGTAIGGVIGGVGGGIAGALGGSSAGQWLGGLFDKDKGAAPLPTTGSKASAKTDQAQVLKEANQQLETATTATATGITEQIKKMDASNALMKTMVDQLQKQTELSEKILIALTMSDKEKSQGDTSKSLRSDTKLGARYNYTM